MLSSLVQKFPRTHLDWPVWVRVLNLTKLSQYSTEIGTVKLKNWDRYSKTCHLRPPLLPQKSGLTWQVVSEQRDTSKSPLSNKFKLFNITSFNDLYCLIFFSFWDILPSMLTILKTVDPNSQDIPSGFQLFNDRQCSCANIFNLCTSMWSLLTGKIWTCGHKKVAFGLTLLGGLWAQVEYIRKTIVMYIQIVVLNERWSLSSGGL